jgi:hypothetical protein
MRISSREGRVSVRLRPPSPLAIVREKLELHASAAVEPSP